MESGIEETHDQLVEKLTTGFGAMLEQVQELARRNTDLEQRLARVREEYQHMTQDDGPLIHDNTPVWLQANTGGTAEQKRRLSGSASSEEQAIWFQGATGEDNAMAIVDGVRAWKILTKGKGPLWRRFNRERASRNRSQESARTDPGQHDLPPGHPSVENDPDIDTKGCPFSALATLGEQNATGTSASARQRPGPLPTPPPTQKKLVEAPTHGASQGSNISPPLSISGSAKCPIRMLDDHSPEEVAKYFEIHKHEIPRSHEICVKRYQSNAQSIRLLDAKYGNLVNMIQGLGEKHQPLLPEKEDEALCSEMDSKSARKVEKWANNVKEAPDGETVGSLAADTDERQGRFDRPLKEVRVGESPTRPWGIPVPGVPPPKDPDENGATSTPKAATSKAKPVESKQQTLQMTSQGPEIPTDDKPRMVFTGPVFIGYGAEQAAALIEKCGWDPHGPSTSNV